MKKKSDMYCIISLLCMFGVPIGTFFITGLFANGDISIATATANMTGKMINFAAYIAAWVIAIQTRIHYKDRFSKTLIIIYSILLALIIIGIILLVAVLAGMTKYWG